MTCAVRTITIAIASSGRPTLVRCLTSLGRLDLPADTAIDVVVADDAPDGRAAALVDEARPFPFAVTVVGSHAGNVSAARNACLDAATGALLAFVDDDEWVHRQWLARLLSALDEFGADCVFGPVHPVYPADTPAWIVRANPLHVDWGQRGRKVTIGRSGNTLMKRAFVVRHKLRFDLALGRTGGEDTEFFHALGQTGAVMVVTDDALVHEDAPPARVNVAYFRHRALRTGQNYARFAIRTAPHDRVFWSLFYGGAAAKAGIALGLGVLFYPIDRARWLQLAMRGWMNVGKLRELFGFTPAEMRGSDVSVETVFEPSRRIDCPRP